MLVNNKYNGSSQIWYRKRATSVLKIPANHAWPYIEIHEGYGMYAYEFFIWISLLEFNKGTINIRIIILACVQKCVSMCCWKTKGLYQALCCQGVTFMMKETIYNQEQMFSLFSPQPNKSVNSKKSKNKTWTLEHYVVCRKFTFRLFSRQFDPKWLTAVHPNEHPNSGVNHARWQPACWEHWRGGVLLRDTWHSARRS